MEVDPTTDSPTTISPYKDDNVIPDTESWFGVCFGLIVIIPGIVGNFLLFLSVVIYKKLRTISNAFIASLALLDIYILCTLYSLNVDVYVKKRWTHSAQVCMWHFLTVATMKTIILVHLGIITFYRFALIVKPAWFRKCDTVPAAVLFLLGAYLIPQMITLGTSMELFISGYSLGVDIIFDVRNMICDRYGTDGGIYPIITVLFIALILMGYMYIAIFRVVKKSADKFKGKQGGREERKELKVLKPVIIILVIFSITFIVPPVFYVIEKRVGYFPHWSHVVINVLDMCSSGTRWLIYGLMNQQFRGAYLSLLKCKRQIAVANGTPTAVSAVS